MYRQKKAGFKRKYDESYWNLTVINQLGGIQIVYWLGMGWLPLYRSFEQSRFQEPLKLFITGN